MNELQPLWHFHFANTMNGLENLKIIAKAYLIIQFHLMQTSLRTKQTRSNTYNLLKKLNENIRTLRIFSL